MKFIDILIYKQNIVKTYITFELNICGGILP